MARKLDVPQSGKVGTVVNVVTRFGQVQRQYVRPRNPQTPDQMRVRANVGHIAARWRTLTDAQREAWTLAGRDAETQRRLGRGTYLTGCQLFIKINATRAALGLEQFDDPPALAKFEANPVGALAISNKNGTIALKLSVPAAPAQYTVVYGAAPCSAGRSSALHYKILGLLPKPQAGLVDITDFYVAKYGLPPAGTRVFIRTRQHINGWEDSPKETTAVVPRA